MGRPKKTEKTEQISEEFVNQAIKTNIKTLHEQKEDVQEQEVKSLYAESPEDFRVALGQAQMEGFDHITVSEKLFNFLVKNNKTRYLTYGTPGIKIYKEGTKDECDSEDSMSFDIYNDYLVKKKLKEKGIIL